MRNMLGYCWLLVAGCGLSLPVSAQVVHLSLPSKLVMVADYQQGKADKPAVILLHGFLQTRLALPMSGLAQTLAAAGYTVLVPTLSEGYHLRNQTLACEAVHSHNMASDTAELASWVSWLAQNTKQAIVLIGHSSGANVVLRYASKQPDKQVTQAILVSIVPTKADPLELQLALKSQHAARLDKYTLAYCQHNYLSTPDNYLSYASWNEIRIISALRANKLPTVILLGGKDALLPSGWVQKIQLNFPTTRIVPNAGHFFDGTAELDLSDEVMTMLAKVAR